MSWWKTAETPSPVPPSPSSGGTEDPDSAVKRISLEAASREELAAFVKQQGTRRAIFFSSFADWKHSGSHQDAGDQVRDAD